MTVLNYINMLQSYEEYSFSLEEIMLAVINPTSENNDNDNYATEFHKRKLSQVKKEIARLVTKNQIVNLRKGFYLIIPPRYSQQGGRLPVQLYVEKLFNKYLRRDYYLGYFTAAKFYGASHQQIQMDYVVSTSPTILNIRNSVNLNFYSVSRNKWPKKNIINKKSDAGYFKISSPILTAVDLIHYQLKLGGLNRIVTILEELAEEIDLKDLQDLLTWYPYKSTLQRLGYFLEVQFNLKNEIIDYLYSYLTKTIKISPIKLNNTVNYLNQDKMTMMMMIKKNKNRWKVKVNIKIESDLYKN